LLRTLRLVVVTHMPKRPDYGLGACFYCGGALTAKGAPDVCVVIVCGYCDREPDYVASAARSGSATPIAGGLPPNGGGRRRHMPYGGAGGATRDGSHAGVEGVRGVPPLRLSH
jgi:hypothetical protein